MADAALIAAIVGVTATAASTGVAVSSSIEAGNQQRAAAKYKAEQLQRQALEAQQAAGIQLAQQDQKQNAILASIRANAAASGVSPGAGSALLDYQSSSEQAQLNDMYTKYAANITASGDVAQAGLTSYGGKIAQQTANITAAGDLFSGVGTIGKLVASNPGAFGFKKSLNRSDTTPVIN